MKNILLILLLSVSNLTIGQTEQNTPNSIWIDKAMVKSDTVAIIKSGHKRINVYVRDAVDTTNNNLLYNTTLVGTWLINIDNTKMTLVWDTKFSNYHQNEKVASRKYKSNKIIEIIGNDDHKFELTHYLDNKGVITHTTNKIKSKFESRYHFDKINYVYKDGLLIEADYFSSNYDPKTIAYTKFEFTYTR